MNLLNNKGQHYDVLGRFRVNTGQGEVEFCRVKFMATKHEDVIPATKVKTGDFEDVSIVVKPTPVKPILVSKSVTEEEKAKLIEAFEEAKKQPMPVEVISEPATVITIIATNPKGEEITVDNLGLEAFCSENKLDLEGVQSVIEGKQKTHRKWRFKTV